MIEYTEQEMNEYTEQERIERIAHLKKTGRKIINKKITSISGTNLVVFGRVLNINDGGRYRVAYIDLVEENAVLVSLTYVDKNLVISLNNCDDFIIVNY